MMESARKQHFETIMQDVGAHILGLSAEVLSQIERQHADLSTNIRSVLLTLLLDAYSNRNNKSVCCDKTPMHVKYIDFIIKEIFDCHVMCIHRDPRDVWLSVRQTPWNTGNPLYHAIFWRRIATLSEKWPRIFPQRYLEVRFEDLVAEPKRVCRFVKVTFSTDMLQRYRRGDRRSQLRPNLFVAGGRTNSEARRAAKQRAAAGRCWPVLLACRHPHAMSQFAKNGQWDAPPSGAKIASGNDDRSLFCVHSQLQELFAGNRGFVLRDNPFHYLVCDQ
jgi:hypothetical protein